MALDHEHPIDPDRVMRAREGVLGPDDAERVATLLRLLADPVRARIVSALHAVGELCVGDLALALDVSDSSVSHALRLLRTAGVVRNRRDGRVIYYRLAGPVMPALLDVIDRAGTSTGDAEPA